MEKQAIKALRSSSNKHVQEEKVKGMPRGWWHPILLFSFLAVALVLAKLFDVTGHLKQLEEWIKSLGNLGCVVFVFIHIVAMIAAIPRSVLAVTAGVLFGSVVGVILVTISAPIGAGLAFLIARYFDQDATAYWVSRSEKLSSLYQIVEERGTVVLVATRLATFSPANMLNYAFGLTRIPFLTYMFWSFLCMLPATVLYVVGADAITKGISELRIPWVLAGAVMLPAIIAAVVGRRALPRFRDKRGAAEPENQAEYRKPLKSDLAKQSLRNV